MSWLFSQALVEEFSEATSWDGAPSAPLSVMPTQHKFWRNDKTMDASQLSRFGLTCAVLTEDRGEALLTWFRADSRVRTYPLPGMAPVLMASVPACGAKWLESSVKYDLDSSSWRTHRCLWDEALPWSSVTLPAWGMTRSGYVYQHPTAERPISAIVSGLWPTLTASIGTKCGGRHKGRADTLSSFLADVERLETSSTSLVNPVWAEWFMGFPSGWSDLKPLEMRKFHEWQRQHSPCLPSREAA